MGDLPEKKVRTFRACSRNITLVVPDGSRRVYTLLGPSEARQLANELTAYADEYKQESEGA